VIRRAVALYITVVTCSLVPVHMHGEDSTWIKLWKLLFEITVAHSMLVLKNSLGGEPVMHHLATSNACRINDYYHMGGVVGGVCLL